MDPSGLRIGTPAVTSRGMGPAEMRQIAAWMDEVVEAVRDGREEPFDRIADAVRELASGFPPPGVPISQDTP